MALNSPDRHYIFPWLVVITAGLLFGCVSLLYPFGRDQAIYAYAGKLLLEGKMNYLHVFDLKPPGIHFLFAFIQLIGGESLLNARIFDIGWQIVTAITVFKITGKITKNNIFPAFAAVSYLFLYYRQDYWHTLQADGSLNLFFGISILLLLSFRNKHSFLKLFFAGISFAAVLLFKYTVISFLPLLIIALIADKKFIFSLRLKNIAVFVTGMLTTAGFVIILYYFTGALKELIDTQFLWTPLYTKIAFETEEFYFIFKHSIKLFTHSAYTPLLLLSIFSMIYSIFKKDLGFEKLLIFSWLISALLSLIIQWKFYNYHFLVIIPAISILGSYGLSLIKELFTEKKSLYRFVLTAFILIFSILAFKPYIPNYLNIGDYFTGKESLNSIYIKNGFTTDSVFMYGKTIKAVDAVKENSELSDKIFVWGFDPLIYYLSSRHCSSRFIYNFPLLWKGENSEFRKEFLGAIDSDKPKLIIVANNDPLIYISGYDEDSKQSLKRFPEFDNIISTRYSFLTSAEDYEIYSRNEW